MFNTHYTYYLINFLSVIFPLLLSFDKKVVFYKQWPKVLIGLLVSGSVFIAWDSWFAVQGVWYFNEQYIVGPTLFHLPIEEILFFTCIPYSCLFVYECMNKYVTRDVLAPYTKYILWFLVGLSVTILFFYYDRIYTCVTFGSLLVYTLCHIFWFKVRYNGRFFLGYAVSLIPFIIVNGFLTAIPVVLYNNAENIGFRWHTIPVEDSFYMLVMLWISTDVWEWLRRERA